MIWKLIDDKKTISWHTSTYEHVLPHGRLIRVVSVFDPDGYERNYKISESMVFVPNPPHTEGPHR